ncbi:MAG: hypothetical protein AUI14_10495 [Actinobacteria bacterium 13_2_20CM_2_71_6]|nr:MAG: hypothetical protein AUI14_10495 [Actinobacteria bacterium 13_2_20CM_2_71_6]
MKGTGPPPAQRAPHRWVVVALAGALLIALPTALALVREAAGPPPSPTPSGSAFACSYIAAAGPGKDDAEASGRAFCARVARDAAARAPLTDTERAAAQLRVDQLLAAIEQPLPCPTPSGEVCVQRRIGQQVGGPTEAELDLVRRTLVADGFTEVTVRLARPDDPVNTGVTIYAVAVGPACIVAYQIYGMLLRRGTVQGRLPDGHCVAP